MLKKTKYLVIFLALLITCMSVAVAADVNETTADYTVTETQLTTDTTSINTELVKTTSEDNNKLTKEKIVKQDANQIEVNDNNFDTYFTSTGLNGVNDGDTISFTSDVTRTTSSYIVNKAVNIEGNNYTLDLNTISGYVSQSNPTYIEFNSGASYSNISYLKFHNTQIYTTTATNVSFDHIDVSVENQGVGRGVGVFSMRSGVINCSVKNSNFDIDENTGCSIIAITLGENCTIDNNTITGQGTVGNLVYLNLWGANLNNANGITQNKNNTISNNIITGPETSSDICIAIVVGGPHNHIINNTINYEGKGITGNWAGTYDETTNTTNDYYNDTYTGNGYINNTLNNGATFNGAQRSLVAGNTFSGTATIAKNSTVKNNIFNAATTINQYSNVTNNIFNSTVTLKNNINFKNNNAENSTVYVNGANCDLCSNRIYYLNVSETATDTMVCKDNVFINGTNGSFTFYRHPTALGLLNKNTYRSVKSSGEPTVINITEENYSDWFSFYEENKLRFKSGEESAKTFYIEYLPPNITDLDLYDWYARGFDESEYSFIGNNLTLNNVNLIVFGARVTLSNMTFNYDDDSSHYMTFRTDAYDSDFHMIINHIKVNYTGGYENGFSKLIETNIGSIGNKPTGVTLQNSEIYVKIPSTTDGFNVILLKGEHDAANDKLINNTITIIEDYATADDTYLTAINVNSKSVEIKDNNITLNGESILTAIKVNTNSNTITNNNITVTSAGTANAVELTGDDSTVTDNNIVANDKAGNDAVTATGENNVVENNTGSVDTHIDTSIELNYDSSPLDIGESVLIQGVFKANNIGSSAEAINIYDNNELIATVNTDENGIFNYTYTITNEETHELSFKFEANDTHKATQTKIIVAIKLSPIVNITTDNFYKYFDEDGELNAEKLANDTTFYFYSIPDEIVELTLLNDNVNNTGKNVTFAGTQDFTLLNKAIVIESNIYNFKLVNMTITYTDEYEEQDYILIQKTDANEENIIDNCIITANITRQTPKGYPYSVISTSNAPTIISNSQITVNTVETEVDWDSNSENYGSNNVIPIFTKSRATIINNIININATSDGSSYPTLYGIRLRGQDSVMTENNITIIGEGWLYAIQPMAYNINITNNNINITGVNYTAGIMMENINNNNIDNNTIILTAKTSREGMLNEPCTYGITIIDYNYMGGTLTETGYAANNKITNNNITCIAYNMYGIEQFGGSNTTIENNTITATGDTAMAVGIIGLNIDINNNNLTVNGTSFTGSTVDYLGATTTGVYLGRGYNATITNNIINSTYAGICAQAQDIATIQNNNITSDYSNTIILDSSTTNTHVENNYLIAKESKGDSSVQNNGSDNTVQNNLPEEITANYLTNDNFYTYFDKNNIILNEYKNQEIIATEIITKAVTISPTGVTLTSTPEGGYSNITIDSTDNVIIENTKADVITIIYSTNTVINNVTMTNNQSQINITESENTIIENCTINSSKAYAIRSDYYSPDTTARYNYIVTPYYQGDYAILGPITKEDNLPKTKKPAMITPMWNEPVEKTMQINETWTMGATFFGPNWESLNDKQIDIIVDGQIVDSKNPQGVTCDVYYTYTATTPGNHTIMMNIADEEYSGNYTFKASVEAPKEYSFKVDTTEFTPGTTATIQASIYYGNEYGQEVAENITKGKVSFKVNGKTLKDANGKVIYAKIINGTATITDYLIPESWKEGSTIQAVYSGSSDLAKMSTEKTEITITTPKPTLTTEEITTTTGSTITLKATINTNTTINTGKIVFKINGKTLKDANGKVIYAKVSNNTVTVEYTLPEEYKAGIYNITAVFISPDYDRIDDTKTLTVN